MPADFNPEDLIGRRVELRGHFADPVTIEGVDDQGEALNLRVRTLRGDPKDTTVDRDELVAALAAAEASPRATEFVKPEDQFLLVESARIRLAYAWDPHFAVSLSGIEPLPHQLEAVYGHMLPQARLRYLLADDPGAGKTIMAGLLFKELRLRGAVERCLILAPAPLAIQWQDEMASKFDEVFEYIESHQARDQLGGSPWSRFPLCVASMDFAKQDTIAPDLLRQRWDMVIIDEAHKVAAADIEHPTLRFKLARELSARTERMLLLTATPHQGNPAQFRNLLSLLDEDAFRSEEAVKRLLKRQDSPWILRRMKEDLRGFDGKKLFLPRHASTVEFNLNLAEYALYEAVTHYVNKFLPRQKGRKKQSAALARMVLQRRLASSLRAIRISLERRHDRLKDILDELNALPEDQRNRRLRELASLPVDPEQEYDDESDEQLDEAAEAQIMVERWELLIDEVDALGQIVELARKTENAGAESKLNKLLDVLEQNEFKSLKDKSGKLLIFTEHRATLDYLREHLEKRGFDVVEIHGSMAALDRKEAQRRFHQDAQILLATDAAGEGINLQFCHLMINYDMPWNPNRLEQRMGRIHRFGQKREVHVFNFVAISGPDGPEAQPVVEGRILQRLLLKLEEIRKAIGDRVFDVIGLLLRTNKINFEDLIREATYNPKNILDFEDEIEQLSAEELAAYEQKTGIALAKHQVDLGRIRGQDFESEEKRLMPEFVEDYFLTASGKTGLRVEKKANPKLLRVEHVAEKFRASKLMAVRRQGPSQKGYPKLSFHKQELMKTDNLDGELISPGHRLYAAVDEVLDLDLRGSRGGTAQYVDPRVERPYRVHFFEVELEGESQGDPSEPIRTVTTHARLIAVAEDPEGNLTQAQPDLLHDLTPVADGKKLKDALWEHGPSADELAKAEGWVRARVQFPLVKALRAEREKEVELRREFLVDAFAASVKEQQKKVMQLHARVMDGDADATLARNEAEKHLKGLEVSREDKLRALEHMGIVRTGRVAHLATAIVGPVEIGISPGMITDEEVEHFAYEFVKQHEAAHDRTVDEVWKRFDGSGFDLRSVSEPDEDGKREVRRIEVKGRALSHGPVDLTPNEWRQAARLGDTYWLYVVWGCKTDSPRLWMVQNPWLKLNTRAQEIIDVKAYRLGEDVLVAVDGEEWTG